MEAGIRHQKHLHRRCAARQCRQHLPGLTQTFAEDFTTASAPGAFATDYAAKWATYNGFADTSGVGTYDNKAMSAHDGVLDEYLNKTADGVTHVAALGPIVTNKWSGQVYGRFSVRFKADALAGFKTAFLLWPDSNIWNEGEIDFPEGNLTNTMWGYNHCPGSPVQNCTYTDTGIGHGSGFHTLTIDWKPTSLTFTIDGRVTNTTTTNIPTHPMHWVLQTEATGAAVTAAGHLSIDWATVYAYTP
jgi:beta-glucanase (GH16 family)